MSSIDHGVRIGAVFLLSLVTSLPIANPNRVQEQRVMVLPSHRDETIDMFFLDSVYGWALVRDVHKPVLVVLKTDDGGKNWQQIGLQGGLHKLFFLNAVRGWALGDCRNPQGFPNLNQVCIFDTTDGGKTWTRLSPTGINSPYRSSDVVLDFRFVDEARGWVVGQRFAGEDGMFLVTTNGGRSFSTTTIEGRYGDLTRILSDSQGNICVLGNYTILTSGDRGETWRVRMPSEQTEKDGVSGQLLSGWVFPGGRWFAVGNRSAGLVLSTDDYGHRWSTVTDSLTMGSQDNGRLTDVSFYDDRNGCATLDWNLLSCTSDGGKTWTNRTITRKTIGEASFQGDSFRKIVLLPNGLGWLISEHGYLYQTSNWGQSWEDRDLLKTAK